MIVDARRTRLGRLALGEQFAYVFDLGDHWSHLCAGNRERVDPLQAYGSVPIGPVVVFGWGDMPDQYGRRWAGDDGESATPPNPERADLPPILPMW